MAKLDDLKQAPELADEISAKTLDTLVAELNMRGYNVTKSELVNRAKQQEGDLSGGSVILISNILIA